jgi:hypothetical protein
MTASLSGEVAMNPEPKPSKTHFHIQWSTKSTLDWATFNTREKAEALAKELVLEGETYSIQERGNSCERCATRRTKTPN